MRRKELVAGAIAVALVAPPVASAADSPVIRTSGQVEWTDLAEPSGARHAPLWGEGASGDRARLVRWKFNTKNPARTDPHDTHFVVLAGTLTLDVEGSEQKQLGPGGFASIPKGTKYTPGCEATGECVFVLHQSPATTAR